MYFGAISVLKALIAILVLLSFQAEAQAPIGPYYQGSFTIDTVFSFTYVAGDGCVLPYQAHINTNGLFPFISGLNINLHVITPATINSNFAPAGSILPVLPNSNSLDVSFPTTWSFALVASGTPTVASEEMPCWIEYQHNATCNSDTANFRWGESLVPCFVGPSVGIDEIDPSAIDIRLTGQVLSVSCDQAGVVSVFTLEGKVIVSKKLEAGFNTFGISNISEGSYIVQFEGQQTTVSKKILLQ
jgi:hypothetical protein